MKKQPVQVGDAIRAVLQQRGCALEAHEARHLAETLIDLICDGLIVPVMSESAHAYNVGTLSTREEVDPS